MAAKKKTAMASRSKGKATAAKHRAIQKQTDALDKKKTGAKKSDNPKPVQAGTRKQPQTPLPEQHLVKPGNEHALEPEPRFLAPDYAGSGKLEGMAAIVTGGDSGIGRAVAVLFAREGADVAVLHLDERKDAETTRRHVEKEGRRCLVIAGDVKDSRFCDSAVRKVMKAFGRLDILVNNAAFQQHVNSLENLTDDHLQETLQTNIGGYFHMARAGRYRISAPARASSTPARRPAFSTARRCSTTPRQKARSMPSPNPWPAICLSEASA